MVDNPDSPLPIVTFDAETSWESLLEVAGSHLDQSGMLRLKNTFSGVVQSIVVEKHYIDRDYRDTFSQFHSKRFSTPDSRCIRLHFFRNRVSRDEIRSTIEPQKYYLGYSVIRPTRPNCIGRTLIGPDSRCLPKVHICVCLETVSIQGAEYEIRGFPFISQDADVTVCAQAALWMVVRYFSNKYPIYPETYPVQIGNLTRDYSVGRLFPSSGLFVWQLGEALRRLGFAPLLYARNQYSQNPDDCCHSSNFEHLLYTYIESGIPVLAAFSSHVVALFGHESDYSRSTEIIPYPSCGFLFSSDLNRAYVGNDDNGVPYQLLTSSPSNIGPSNEMKYSISQIEQFVVPLPEKVFLSAEYFEILVKAILKRTDFGYKALSPKIATNTPILRLFLTTGRSFKKRLSERGMGNLLVMELYRSLPLPHFIWVCEISHVSLYPKSVLGEIIWDATRNAYEADGWIALHYPETLIVDRGSALNESPNLTTFRLEDSIAYPIYRNNLRDSQ